MTQRTKAGLQANFNADIADNSTGDISAADVRNNLIDFSDSVPFLGTADNTLSGSFSGSFEGDGSNLTGVTVTTADTASNTPNALTTASVSSNVITFTKGDASTFNITVDTGSAGGGSTFPYTGSAGISGSLTVEGPTILSGSADIADSLSITGSLSMNWDMTTPAESSASIQAEYVSITGNDFAQLGGFTTTYLTGASLTSLDPAQKGNIVIRNTEALSSTKGYTQIDAGNLYMSGSTINSTGSWSHEGPTVLTGSLVVSGSVTIGREDGAGIDLGVYSINTGSFQIDYLDMEVYSDTTIDALSIGSTVSNFEIKNSAIFGGTKGYIKLNAGDLYMTGSTINSTGPWTHANDLTVQGVLESPTLTKLSGSAGITGSLDIVGDFTVDKSGDSYLNTGSILVSNLELLGNASALMRGRVNTEIRGESLYDASPALPGNITIANTLTFGNTKGYTKIDAGNFFISGSAIYIQTSALPTSEPSDSGQLWLSGSAGSSKYLMVRD